MSFKIQFAVLKNRLSKSSHLNCTFSGIGKHLRPKFVEHPMERKAILLGASGLIGDSLLQQLLLSDHYIEVLVVVRKHLNIQHPNSNDDRLIEINAAPVPEPAALSVLAMGGGLLLHRRRRRV